jgi:hypothetical protein
MKKKPCPKEEEVFELTLDGDLFENTPLGVLQAFGLNPKGYRYRGAVVTGQQTKRFMLVRIGRRPNMHDAKAALKAAYGPTLPEGQWIKTFTDAHEPNNENPVGVADGSWVAPDGGSLFPFVHRSGERCMEWAGFTLYGNVFWLVFAPDEPASQSK